MNIPSTLMAAAILALAGCATPAERAAQMEREMDHMVQVYGPACERLGYKAQTDPWRNCVLHLKEQDTYARYYNYPLTTTCFGHPGLVQCSTF